MDGPFSNQYFGSPMVCERNDGQSDDEFSSHCWKQGTSLIDNNEIEKKWLEGIEKVGITSGASTPDKLVYEIVKKLEPKKVIRFPFRVLSKYLSTSLLLAKRMFRVETAL